MTDFEKYILNTLRKHIDLTDMVYFLQKNDYKLSGQSEENNQPAKLELCFEYCGEYETSEDGIFKLYVLIDEDIFELYSNKDREYDEFIKAFFNRKWFLIDAYTKMVIPSFWNDGELVYLDTDRKNYEEWKTAHIKCKK